MCYSILVLKYQLEGMFSSFLVFNYYIKSIALYVFRSVWIAKSLRTEASLHFVVRSALFLIFVLLLLLLLLKK